MRNSLDEIVIGIECKPRRAQKIAVDGFALEPRRARRSQTSDVLFRILRSLRFDAKEREAFSRASALRKTSNVSATDAQLQKARRSQRLEPPWKREGAKIAEIRCSLRVLRSLRLDAGG
jgi:hypothetical protein